MNARLETTTTMTEVLKWGVAAALFVAAFVAFYAYSTESLLLRVVGLLVAVGLSGAIIYTTRKGREIWNFLRDARTETRRVVWPTRTETLQTTGIVIAMVSLLAIIMWGFDSVLSVAVKALLRAG